MLVAMVVGGAPARADVSLGVEVRNVGAPAVAILAPGDGAQLTAGVPVAVRARAERSERLHLAVDGVPLGTTAGAALEVVWTPPPGPHTLVALAQAEGAPDALASVQVTGTAPPPPPPAVPGPGPTPPPARPTTPRTPATPVAPARPAPAPRCRTAAERRTPACRCRTRAATRTRACLCRNSALKRTRVCRTLRRPATRRSTAAGSLGGALRRLPPAPPARGLLSS